MLSVSILGHGSRSSSYEYESREEAQGRILAQVTVFWLFLGGSQLARRFARVWARAASESIASSEDENRRVLQISRSSAVPFALYLRGFEEEGRSLDSLFVVPFTKRVDKATRWIESEIVDELQRRGRRVFCIANPSDTFLLPGAIRLQANHEDWLCEVSALASESEVVVVYLSVISQGLLAELDLLRRQNLMEKTVLFVFA